MTRNLKSTDLANSQYAFRLLQIKLQILSFQINNKCLHGLIILALIHSYKGTHVHLVLYA